MAVIAGKVAPRFMGAFNPSTTYQFYDAVTHNNKLYFCKKSGTVGKTPTGATDDNWFLSLDGTFTDASSLGGETAEAWQTKIDNIQSTITGATGGTGWYRVAELATTSFIDSPSCFITVKRTGSKNEVVLLRLDVTVNTQRFALLSSVNNVQYLTAVRLTTENAKTYVEIYHTNSGPFNYHISILDNASRTVPWKAIAPTATSENVGTVLTTYDIPANASPVTDLDLENALHGVTILTALPTGITNDSTMQELINAMPTYSMLNLARAMSPLTPESYCELTVIKSTTAYVIAFAKSQYTSNVYMGGVNTVNEWDGWHKYATTADLANYLPKSGGVLEGNFPLTLNDVVNTYSYLGFQSKGAPLGFIGIEADGSPMYMNTAWSAWKLLHSGNYSDYALPKTGGTVNGGVTVNANTHAVHATSIGGSIPLIVESTDTSSANTMIGIKKNGSYLGYISWDSTDINNPRLYIPSGVGTVKLHHDGNSAKVAIQSTAPTDTTALWVDTANKVTKAYIDGAWTQVA